MSRIVENPAGIDDTYLDCLNVCFRGNWCSDSYRWYLKRAFGGRSPDIIALYEGDELAAGVGINYRQLTLHGHVSNVAILTAAWTLPRFRGRWHFSKLIRAAKRIAREKGCTAMLSFVTEHNASASILNHCGAYAIPTRYIHAPAGQGLKLPSDVPEAVETNSTDGWHSEPNGGVVSFRYVSDCDWGSQFVFRAHPVIALNVENAEVIVERVGETDRLQYISDRADALATLAAMARHSQRKSRHLFYFTTSEPLASGAARMGMNVQAGYIMIIDLPMQSAEDDAVLQHLRASKWKVQPGDRM